MVLRVLRIFAVASILAIGLTARAVTAAQADTDDVAGDPPPAVADLPAAGLGEQPPTDPPPTEPPPAEVEPPSAEPLEPAPTDTTSTDTPLTDSPPTDTPSTDPPVAAEPLPTASDAPSPSDEEAPASTASPDPSAAIGDPAISDPSAAEVVPPLPSALPSPVAVSPLLEDPPHTATAPTSTDSRDASKPIVGERVERVSRVAPTPVASGAGQHAHAPAAVPPAEASRSVEPRAARHMTRLVLPDDLEPATAGLVAGLAVANRVPASVAVAIEFGRAGGGWAGGIVFNLWLRRKLRERPMSQRQLAALSGVDHSTISRLLRQDRTPSLETATKLAKALRHVQGESDTADYFDRTPEETLFPARRVEMALRSDGLLDDQEVRRLMNIYLAARRKHQAAASSNELSSTGRPSAPARDPTRAAPDSRR
ncbi:MAG TPA: helix-turn-helix domain-containing protein [Candidatus Limnocylindrales bacterium]|nr:helix-turn-helix domain-containing protein [Candidatus Limnocylindrales bacterium]